MRVEQGLQTGVKSLTNKVETSPSEYVTVIEAHLARLDCPLDFDSQVKITPSLILRA